MQTCSVVLLPCCSLSGLSVDSPVHFVDNASIALLSSMELMKKNFK